MVRDPHGLPAALYRRARSAVRRGQRERAAGQSRFPQHPLARARNAGRRQPQGRSASSGYAPSPRQSHCFFEWIYFANVASTLDDRSVYLSRAALGKELARLEDVPLDADTIVVPVPDTAKAAADAMAFALGVPSVEGLMRNRYVGRTFIEGTADRAAKARLKYTPLPEVLAGKRVLLVEDSIVRSTTMRALVHEIRDRGGAREIHLRVACPPIIAPCYYGIDMSRKDELFATPFIDLPGGGVSAAAPAAHGPGARGRQPALPARRGDRALGQPLARAPLPRLHHGPVPHRDRPVSLPDRKRQAAASPTRAERRAGLRAGLSTRLHGPAIMTSAHSSVMSTKDRPPLEAILALEVGQVVERRARASSSSGTGCSRKRGFGGDQALDQPKYSSTSLATCSSPPGSSARSICATSSSVNTRRFLCRFFHHGSGK